jgi:hypothetical protein
LRIAKSDDQKALEERFTVSGETRTRVEKCGDNKRLKEWARRALAARSLDDVFAED